MVDFLLENFKQKVKGTGKRIVFPEAIDLRILSASRILKDQDLCVPVLLGDKSKILSVAQANNINVDDLEIIDTVNFNFENYANTLFELRKHKGLTLEEAQSLVKQEIYLGTLMLYDDEVHGLVSGAMNPTAHTIKPALQIIKTRENVKLASSFFLMDLQEKIFFFADCGFVINPDAEQLSEIAISTADSAKIFGFEPRVAMLSFSTHGSAKHELVDKVANATNIVKQKRPDLLVDGELQLDAAIVPSVAQSKCPNSVIKGDANILIFPDLNSGNIGYKLVERLAKSKAIGPIIQGLRKPVNDLSRGCSVEDIINVAVITVLEAQR